MVQDWATREQQRRSYELLARYVMPRYTGALAGAAGVFDAAFRRAGVLRVTTIPDLFNMSEILALQPQPRGPALAALGRW